ncbi:hypothetical protein COV89_02635 [Candidatus Shapirobacteria bacterium CG11_big_fil_rev_8_21_14_0_20_40_12]|uniref:Glycosyltransferase subfamily 4-like N-terminal domain-containing protein n=1 Tax=Candidatus Shapirobacteria bacterium CG11_big_fil_rev_8_21_14_0_20_40_12 TaxID=1974889 RepID=A0A2H0KFL8_9BACT|nr:MAG: hypothetical protein COV89_02635 [Candidatus Shapirobacteria bacterium CG11_big_fil_rev_8_21_14_0_20_40_12]
MKILMLTPYLPYPPSSGGQVRSYNLIKNLASKHEITLFSLIKNEKEKSYIVELEKYCHKVRVFNRPSKPWTLKNILRTGFSLYPFLVIRNLSEEEKRAVVEELNTEKYDLIHAETFYVMPHIPETKVPILLVDQTIEFQVYQHYVKNNKNFFLKPFLYLDVFKIKYWELAFWQKADMVVAVSDSDKVKMIKFVDNLKVRVVPNGAGEDLMNVWMKKEPQRIPIVFFQANFSWLQNIEAASTLVEKIFPLIKEKISVVQCRIVGQSAKEKVGGLGKKDIKVIDLENSDIKGVIDAYKKATVFVAPLEGPGGTRLKILGAMAAGVPIVTSQIGIEGIEAVNNQEVLVGRNWREMAEKTISLLKNKKVYDQLALNARKLVEEKYSYKSIADLLSRFYLEVSGGRN